MKYDIARELGGDGGVREPEARARGSRGLRLAATWCPITSGIDAAWVVNHPDWFIQTERAAVPGLHASAAPISRTTRASASSSRTATGTGPTRRSCSGAHDRAHRAGPLHLPRQRRHQHAVERHRAARLPERRGPRRGHRDDPPRRAHVPDHPLRRGDDAREAPLLSASGSRSRAAAARSRRAPSYAHDARASSTRVFPVEFWREVVDRVAARRARHAAARRGLLDDGGLLRPHARHAPCLQLGVHEHAEARGEREVPRRRSRTTSTSIRRS